MLELKWAQIPLSEITSTNIGLNWLQKSSSNQLWALHVISVVSASEFSFKNKHATFQKVKKIKMLSRFQLELSQFSELSKKICEYVNFKALKLRKISKIGTSFWLFCLELGWFLGALFHLEELSLLYILDHLPILDWHF